MATASIDERSASTSSASPLSVRASRPRERYSLRDDRAEVTQFIARLNPAWAAMTAILVVADDDSGPVTVELVSTGSSDPDEGLGKGDKPNDIIQVDLDTFLVRAELGKDSQIRTYSFTYRATDGWCGLTDEATLTVTVQPRR